ncbi:hypothetical protein [Enterococcus sp. DIV1314a]|uniref:hypothetical protein n=1 Tax=Enterococcus sp. DIV1314a TaxID=2774660 RepID=UPI003F295122
MLLLFSPSLRLSCHPVGNFFVIFTKSFSFLIGPIGGFGLGLFTTYRNQTILNCFGALLLAQDRYGIGGSVQLRIWNNVIGLLFVGIYLLSLKVLSLLYNQLKRRKVCQNNC